MLYLFILGVFVLLFCVNCVALVLLLSGFSWLWLGYDRIMLISGVLGAFLAWTAFLVFGFGLFLFSRCLGRAFCVWVIFRV